MVGLSSRRDVRIAVSHEATHRARGSAIVANLDSLQPALAAPPRHRNPAIRRNLPPATCEA